jgi:hypothetical protein
MVIFYYIEGDLFVIQEHGVDPQEITEWLWHERL